MKKVLIIGFFWPFISGSKRISSISDYLTEFRWQPIIITPKLNYSHNKNYKVIETNYMGLVGSLAKSIGFNEFIPLSDQLSRKIKYAPEFLKSSARKTHNFFNEVFAFPDEHKNWYPFAYHAAKKLLGEDKNIHAVISVWPVTSHWVAFNLKKEYNLFWIADFADLWSGNSAYPYGKVRKIIDVRLEKKILSKADAITTSSKPLAERLSKTLAGRHVKSIMLGFDPELLVSQEYSSKGILNITYTGIFYPIKRDPAIFFDSIKELIDENKLDRRKIQVNIYGRKNSWIACQILDRKLEDVVIQHGEVPYSLVVEKQREADLLLHINWNDKNERGVFSGKFLDYLAAKRTILAAGGTGTDEVIKEILDDTNAGVYCVTKEEIKRELLKFNTNYITYGKISYEGNLKNILNYSSQNMAHKFALILNEKTV